MDDPADANPAPSALDDELRKLEAEVFGPDAPRKPDGTPLELGHGSNYSKAHPDSKARYHALMTLKASEAEVAALTQQLENAKTTRETHRLAIKAAAAQAEEQRRAAEFNEKREALPLSPQGQAESRGEAAAESVTGL